MIEHLDSPPAIGMDHSAFTDEYSEYFNALDDDDAVTMDSTQHARAPAAVCIAVCAAINADGSGPHGSIAGRKANMNREFDVGVQRMMTDCFNETPTYEDNTFAHICLKLKGLRKRKKSV
jgi:hypothetical protein